MSEGKAKLSRSIDNPSLSTAAAVLTASSRGREPYVWRTQASRLPARFRAFMPRVMTMNRENTNAQSDNATVGFKGPKGEAAHEPQFGKVRATVWKNLSENTGRHYYKMSIRRVETDKDGKVHLENSFWPEDMKDVAAAATSCRIWLEDNTDAFERQREWKRDKMKRSKRPKASNSASPASAE
jgi:hypothetical protein